MATDVRPRDPSIQSPMVPLATLIGLEIRGGKSEKPSIKYGNAAFAKRGEDYFLVRPDCFRVPGDATSLFSVFAVSFPPFGLSFHYAFCFSAVSFHLTAASWQIFDGHNGASAAVFAKEHLLDHVMSVIPQGISREEWLEALPRALVAGETSGTTATLVVIDGWTVTVASVGDSRCILDSQDGVVSLLTVDHRLEENVEERERVTASGGEVGRLNLCGGKEVGPLRCWPGGLCLSRSIGDTDVGEFIVPIPHVKQVKLSAAGGRLIIASDGIWDALPSELAAKACRGLPAELAAKLVVKEALRKSGLKDDTTCLVVDIIPPEHTFVQSPTIKQQNKFRSLIFGKKSKNGVGKPTKLSSVGAVEELFEEGSAMLEERFCTRQQDPPRGSVEGMIGGVVVTTCGFGWICGEMRNVRMISIKDCLVQQAARVPTINAHNCQPLILWAPQLQQQPYRLGKNFSPTEDSGTLRCAICQTDRVSDDDLLIDSSDSFSATSKAWEGPYLCHDCRRKKDAMEGKRPRESTMSR
ncbi:hypothetical protein ZIOFF_056744 [Zingiber officinale]|uniref:protein-serine/threonine phosphatase n=1 Tax=Zingiber officinale TaxID=94328 RepID=A0A8J5KPM0_ZINOF|nr:hypothetical protein ZIOFF_056744 [Zingiber officinale]